MKVRTITNGRTQETHAVQRVIRREGHVCGPGYSTRCGIDTRDGLDAYFVPTDGRHADCPRCANPVLSSVALIEVTALGAMFDQEPRTVPLHDFALDNPGLGGELYELQDGQELTIGGGAAQEYRVRRIK